MPGSGVHQGTGATVGSGTALHRQAGKASPMRGRGVCADESRRRGTSRNLASLDFFHAPTAAELAEKFRAKSGNRVVRLPKPHELLKLALSLTTTIIFSPGSVVYSCPLPFAANV